MTWRSPVRLLPGLDGFFIWVFQKNRYTGGYQKTGELEQWNRKKNGKKKSANGHGFPCCRLESWRDTGEKGKCGSRQFQNMAFRPVLRHRPRQSRKTRLGNWHFTIRKQQLTSGFFFVMRLFWRKKRKILMLFIPSPRNRTIIEMRYSALPCNTASISAGKWRMMMPRLQKRWQDILRSRTRFIWKVWKSRKKYGFPELRRKPLWHCKIVLPDPGSRLSWRSNWTGRNGMRRIFRWKVQCFLMLIFGKTRFQIRRFFTRTGSI